MKRFLCCAASWPAVVVTAVLLCGLWASGHAHAQPAGRVRKPAIADTIRANIYADNWFMLYINGELVAVDSIAFIPHNVISVDILPSYPMTIAVMAKDNADPKTGMEYANTNIGDGGFILKFGDGTVTDASWTDDLLLDNTVLFRRTIPKPPDGRQRPDFTNLNNTVPDGPPKPGGGRGPGNRPPGNRPPGGGPQ